MRDRNRSEAPLVSVVVPIYREADNVKPLLQRLRAVFQSVGCDWEVVFAMDPSPDHTREEIVSSIHKGEPVRLVCFSRRIGKPISLMAGLEHARGDVCVIMDADLQDPPELITEMLAKWQEGFNVVIAQRTSRKGEGLAYLKAAELFYWILDHVSEVKVPKNTGDFRLLDRTVVTQACRFRERHGFLRGITAATGFSTAIVPFERDPRLTGRTQISFSGAVNIALDGIIPFSRLPVRMIFWAGVIFVVSALLGGMVGTAVGLARGFPDLWPVFFLCTLSIGLCGMVLVALGVIGEYLVRTYEETRDRPWYIVEEILESETLASRSESIPPRR
ncbi:MAG: glycosyltransferase family 2 protein [Thermodesulfobacteriota bacterium]